MQVTQVLSESQKVEITLCVLINDNWWLCSDLTCIRRQGQVQHVCLQRTSDVVGVVQQDTVQTFCLQTQHYIFRSYFPEATKHIEF